MDAAVDHAPPISARQGDADPVALADLCRGRDRRGRAHIAIRPSQCPASWRALPRVRSEPSRRGANGIMPSPSRMARSRWNWRCARSASAQETRSSFRREASWRRRAACAAVGATPVFADVDPDSQTINACTIAAVLTPRTRAVIAVHLAGWPAPMDEIMTLANAYDLLVIEDCAQAHGARLNGRPVGSFGDAAAFSFCTDKIISTGGEGGLLVLRDKPSLGARMGVQGPWQGAPRHANIAATPPTNDGSFRWLHHTSRQQLSHDGDAGRHRAVATRQARWLGRGSQPQRPAAQPPSRAAARRADDAAAALDRPRLLQILCLHPARSAGGWLDSRPHPGRDHRRRRSRSAREPAPKSIAKRPLSVLRLPARHRSPFRGCWARPA